jgi:hypothetical protein
LQICQQAIRGGFEVDGLFGDALAEQVKLFAHEDILSWRFRALWERAGGRNSVSGRIFGETSLIFGWRGGGDA